MCREILDVKHKYKNSIFWLGGDFNLPDIDWPSNSICGHQYPAAINELYLQMSFNLGLTQHVLTPTRLDNILDLFCTNFDFYIKKVTVIPGVSDHEAFLINSNLNIRHKNK